MPEPIITKHRPEDLDEFFGNKPTIKLCEAFVDDEEGRPQTYLFHGEKGCGKTTLARVLSNEYGADEGQIIEIDCLQDRSIEMVRNIHRMVSSPPLVGSIKAFLIDEVHTLPKLSQEGFLKDTEEPPEYAYFFLCSTEPDRILGTLRDRCLQIELKRLKGKEMGKFIAVMCNEEEVELTPSLLKIITSHSEGNPRKILKAIYLAKSLEDAELKEMLATADEDDPEIIALSRYLIYKRGNVLDILNSLQHKDPETVRRAVLKYMQKVILNPKDKKKIQKALVTVEAFSEFPSNGFIDIIMATFESVS